MCGRTRPTAPAGGNTMLGEIIGGSCRGRCRRESRARGLRDCLLVFGSAPAGRPAPPRSLWHRACCLPRPEGVDHRGEAGWIGYSISAGSSGCGPSTMRSSRRRVLDGVTVRHCALRRARDPAPRRRADLTAWAVDVAVERQGERAQDVEGVGVRSRGRTPKPPTSTGARAGRIVAPPGGISPPSLSSRSRGFLGRVGRQPLAVQLT